MFFTLIYGDIFLILADCVRDESCREKIVPTSQNDSNIQDAAVNSAHRCTLWAFLCIILVTNYSDGWLVQI